MSDSDVYDFENIVEGAAKALLERYEMTAFTSADERDLQTARPRTDLYFTLGAGLLRWAPRASLPAWMQSERIESAWKAKLHFVTIVNADSNGRQTMAVYRTKLRKIIPSLPRLLNGELLLYHAIKLPQWTGDSRIIKPQDGYEQLTITIDFDFSVQANAWALLEADPQPQG